MQAIMTRILLCNYRRVRVPGTLGNYVYALTDAKAAAVYKYAMLAQPWHEPPLWISK